MRVMGRLLEHVHGGTDIGECGLWLIISHNKIGNSIVFRTIEHAFAPSIYLNICELFWIIPKLTLQNQHSGQLILLRSQKGYSQFVGYIPIVRNLHLVFHPNGSSLICALSDHSSAMS
jgi:hypothetical protein